MDPQRRVRYQGSAYHSALSEEHQKIVLEAETGPTLFGGVQAWLERTPVVQTVRANVSLHHLATDFIPFFFVP